MVFLNKRVLRVWCDWMGPYNNFPFWLIKLLPVKLGTGANIRSGYEK